MNEQQRYVKMKHIFKVSKLLSKGCNRGNRGKPALAEPLLCARYSHTLFRWKQGKVMGNFVFFYNFLKRFLRVFHANTKVARLFLMT